MSWRDYPCKLWTGASTTDGYGRKRVGGRLYLTHRLAWEEAHGPIPEGVNVLHHCDTPACYEVEHLFLGTQADNVNDMVVKGRHNPGNQNAAKTHCKHGHEFTEENTIRFGDGHRECRICRNALNRTAYRRRRGRAA